MSHPNARPRQTMFLLAAVFNGVAGLGLIFHPLWFGWLEVSPYPENAMFIVLFAVLVLVFGYGYYLAALDFERNRPIVLLGAIGKLLVFATFLGFLLLGKTTWHLPIIAIGDLVFAVLFIRALRGNRRNTGTT